MPLINKDTATKKELEVINEFEKLANNTYLKLDLPLTMNTWNKKVPGEKPSHTFNKKSLGQKPPETPAFTVIQTVDRMTGQTHYYILAQSESAYLSKIPTNQNDDSQGKAGRFADVLFACPLKLINNKWVICPNELTAIKKQGANIADRVDLIVATRNEFTFTQSVLGSHGFAIVAEDKQVYSYLEVPYLQGMVNLRDFLKTNTSLTDAFTVAINFTQALAEMHDKKIVHRDLKPHNIMVNPKTLEVKIIDFGLSKSANDSELKQGGSLLYTAPDRHMLGIEGKAVDIYAASAVLAEIFGAELENLYSLKNIPEGKIFQKTVLEKASEENTSPKDTLEEKMPKENTSKDMIPEKNDSEAKAEAEAKAKTEDDQLRVQIGTICYPYKFATLFSKFTDCIPHAQRSKLKAILQKAADIFPEDRINAAQLNQELTQLKLECQQTMVKNNKTLRSHFLKGITETKPVNKETSTNDASYSQQLIANN